MEKLLRILSVLALYLPNLAFVGFVLLSVMAESVQNYPADAGHAEFTRIINMTGLAVFGATVLGMISRRAIVRVPLAWTFAVVSVLFFFGMAGEKGADGKTALIGLGAVLVATVATVACMGIAKLFAWMSSKVPDRP